MTELYMFSIEKIVVGQILQYLFPSLDVLNRGTVIVKGVLQQRESGNTFAG